jgi:hypothetical protein
MTERFTTCSIPARSRRRRLHPGRHPQRTTPAFPPRDSPDRPARPEQTPYPGHPPRDARPRRRTRWFHRHRPGHQGPRHDRTPRLHHPASPPTTRASHAANSPPTNPADHTAITCHPQRPAPLPACSPIVTKSSAPSSPASGFPDADTPPTTWTRTDRDYEKPPPPHAHPVHRSRHHHHHRGRLDNILSIDVPQAATFRKQRRSASS